MTASRLSHRTQQSKLVRDRRLPRKQLGKAKSADFRGDRRKRTTVLRFRVGLWVIGVDVGATARLPDQNHRLLLAARCRSVAAAGTGRLQTQDAWQRNTRETCQTEPQKTAAMGKTSAGGKG